MYVRIRLEFAGFPHGTYMSIFVPDHEDPELYIGEILEEILNEHHKSVEWNFA